LDRDWIACGATALQFAMSATKVELSIVRGAQRLFISRNLLRLLYWVLEQIIPGTFAASTHFSQSSAIYFSFVTLATLGYGDIAPRGDIARGLPSSKALVVNYSWQSWSQGWSACTRSLPTTKTNH